MKDNSNCSPFSLADVPYFCFTALLPLEDFCFSPKYSSCPEEDTDAFEFDGGAEEVFEKVDLFRLRNLKGAIQLHEALFSFLETSRYHHSEYCKLPERHQSLRNRMFSFGFVC